jgi:hypothetical protein
MTSVFGIFGASPKTTGVLVKPPKAKEADKAKAREPTGRHNVPQGDKAPLPSRGAQPLSPTPVALSAPSRDPWGPSPIYAPKPFAVYTPTQTAAWLATPVCPSEYADRQRGLHGVAFMPSQLPPFVLYGRFPAPRGRATMNSAGNSWYTGGNGFTVGRAPTCFVGVINNTHA